MPAAIPGAELLRLLGDHPRAGSRALTAERQAGKPIGEVFPQLGGYDLPTLVKIEDVDVGRAGRRVLLPAARHHAGVIKALPRGPKVVDLSADFRLRDPQLYERTYGHPHQALELQEHAVYGLTEHYREAIRASWLVANPGCFTTTAELPLVPLLKERPDRAGRRSSSTPSRG